MTTKPKASPGARGSRSGRPVMKLLDVLGRRWSLRVLWELHRAGGPLTFRALQAAAGELSPSVLNARLPELRELGIIEAGADGYRLTPAGIELGAILLGLTAWAERNVSRGAVESAPALPVPAKRARPARRPRSSPAPRRQRPTR